MILSRIFEIVWDGPLISAEVPFGRGRAKKMHTALLLKMDPHCSHDQGGIAVVPAQTGRPQASSAHERKHIESFFLHCVCFSTYLIKLPTCSAMASLLIDHIVTR